MGEKSVRVGISCNSCHTSGHTNSAFFIPGLSDKPGTVDLTNTFWNEARENNKFDPVVIPSLRGLKDTAPYGSDNNFNTITSFIPHVEETEFGGPALTTVQITAIAAYLSALRLPDDNELSSQVKATATEQRTFTLLLDTLNLPRTAVAKGPNTEIDMLMQLTKRLLGLVAELPKYADRAALLSDFSRALPKLVHTSPNRLRLEIAKLTSIL